MKKEFDDDWEDDLSGYKVISIEDLNKGFVGDKSALGDYIVNKDNSPYYRSPFHDYRNTPLGYSYLTDNPVSIFASTGVNDKGETGYEYYAEVLPCETGSQVYGSYQANARKKQALFLFYEKPNPNKSNFSGDFYIAKMGDYFVQLFKRFPEPLPSNINGQFFRNITSIEDEAAYLTQLAYTFEKDKIDANIVHQALMREYQFYTGDRRFEEIIGNISSIPADAIGWCAEKLEAFKPTEKNYNPKAKDYSPLIPIIGGVGVPVTMNKAAQFFENLGDNPFVQGAEVAFSKVWSMVKQAANKVKEASIGHLPDAFKKLVNKITGVINDIKSFLTNITDDLSDMIKQGVEVLKIANAFYCGFNSGLISLIQCLLYILEFLLQPTTAFSYQQYLERRDLMEKAEDILDWVTENVPKFLQGIKDLFKASGSISQSDTEGILDKMKEYFGDVSRYTVAFYVGIFAFELLINILLLIFTEGAGNVVKGATYAQKAASLLKVLARETVSVATLGITDLLTFLSRFIIRFGKACAKGFKGFIRFVEELLQGAKNGAKAEDLAMTTEEIEEIVLQGKKVQSIFNILASARIGFKKLGIEILAKADGYLLKWREKPIFKGDFKEVNAFWSKILKPRIGTGTGGILKYLEVLSRNMVAQEHNMSCAAACIRQLAKDHGIELTEKVIREFARTTEEMGTFPDGILDALKKVFKDKEILDRTFIRNPDNLMPLILEDISKEGSWIGIVLPENGNYHVIIVDKIVDGKVFVRDPWPPEGIGKGKGIEAVIGLDEFADSWLRGGASSYHVK
ncbi:cysteine peptidase family C39 domain-containing protein [Chryseobacterium sp. WLY505]|uniref:cysteine peptidase family C39 domain-containing protein n=1 Tax=Chryseobacterium sp. WLY505 TaxID=3068892 RepID=UPI0027966D65|nr:cysteine peptidase family C39 domain-containing protein [Chryseobacterium sp. WLY505]MDQ1856765.1 cysteine peptidase family C39 domain-containing protein [Chryseobacterium sp. WLY505]